MQSVTRAVVMVSNADIDNLVVQATPCPRIRGRMTLDGASASVKDHLFFGVQDAGNGNFAIPCAAQSIYFIQVPTGPGIYVKLALLDGKDVTNSPLDLTAPGDKVLDIAFSSRAAEVRGTVRGAEGKPLAAAPVSLWSFNGPFEATTESAPDGTFSFTSLAPGNYRIAAWNGLRAQPEGSGIETVSEFRDAFEATVTHINLLEERHAEVDPALIPRAAIEQAAERLRLNAVMTQPAEQADVLAAVKSPETLAAFFKSHGVVDWAALRTALGLPRDTFGLAPCGANFPFGDAQCTTQIESIPQPEQAILTVDGGVASHAEEHLRYLRDSGGGWRFAGDVNAQGHYEVPSHRIMQFGSKPFLVVSTDHSQNGAAIGQKLEEWYDLTATDFKPVFSFTAEGSTEPFCVAIGREFKSTFATSVAEGVEKIEVQLELRIYGGGDMGPPQSFTGMYERRQGEQKFTLRSATIPTQDFERLADPFDVPSEKLLQYGFAWLQKVAAGRDSDARQCLGLMLERSPDTPEKRALLDLLSKH